MEDDFYDDILYGGGEIPVPKTLEAPRASYPSPQKREMTWDETTRFDHLKDHYTPHVPMKNVCDSNRSERTWRRWFRLFRGQE